eukprot:8305710-Alexandrium_andersonii.AAC.1
MRPIPARRQIPINALLPAHASREAANPRSWAMAARPRPSAVPLTMPASSASPEIRTMVFCVLECASTPQSQCPHRRGGGPIALPREVVDAPRAHDQIP